MVLTGFALAVGLLLWRVIDLQVYKRDFLQYQGDVRHLREVVIPAHRGMITDRHGEALAISTPVDTLWINPQAIDIDDKRVAKIEQILDLKPGTIGRQVKGAPGREFLYLKRHVTPDLAGRVLSLGLPGVASQDEYRRYYPTGPVAAHVVGFTDIDDNGQEGVELAWERALSGSPGSKRVLKDRLGRTIRDVEQLRPPRPGDQLTLSIDRRIQYLAQRELAAAVQQHGATGGSVVVLDTTSGEVLAMANQPDFNPNNRRGMAASQYRNRAMTDTFEPGSTLKPFTIVCGIESGRYHERTVIDTAPGYFTVAGHTIRDHRNYGTIDLPTVLSKSSNVAASKIALSTDPRCLWSVLRRVGFGDTTGSAFPGEAYGLLSHYQGWRQIQVATIAYGYGVSATALQLAQAYAVLAADGVRRPVSFIRVDEPPKGKEVIDARVAKRVRAMLEGVVSREGTGSRAAVRGFRVAGKTGTAHKPVAGGYHEDRYRALFAGIAPASRPRLVTVVMIDEPSRGQYFGGQVAAPVFSSVMGGALRLLNITPDQLPMANREQPASGSDELAGEAA